MTIIIVGALPAAAQSETGWMLSSEDDSVLIGIQRDITVGATETAEGVVVVEGDALILGAVEGLFAVDANVTLSGSAANVQNVFTVGGTLVVETGATVGEGYYAGTEVTVSPTAVVEGEIVNAQEEMVGALAAIVALLIVGLIFIIIGGVIAVLAVTLLVVAFGTNQVRRAAATISNDVLKTILVGLLMLILPSVVFGLLFVTIVGIPLAIGLMALWSLVDPARPDRGRCLDRRAHPATRPHGQPALWSGVPRHADPGPALVDRCGAAAGGHLRHRCRHPGRLARPAERRHAARASGLLRPLRRVLRAAAAGAVTLCTAAVRTAAAVRAAAPAGPVAPAGRSATRRLAAGLAPSVTASPPGFRPGDGAVPMSEPG